MEYWVAIEAGSPLGKLLMNLRGKIGGATNVVECEGITHPLIVGTDIDWSMPNFVRLTHHRNPGADNPLARELVVPCSQVLFAMHVLEPLGEASNTQTKQISSLH